MKKEDCQVGMVVKFGRYNGEQTLAKIKKINPKKCKLEQLEPRGVKKTYPVGTIWSVPYSMMSPTTQTPAPTTETWYKVTSKPTDPPKNPVEQQAESGGSSSSTSDPVCSFVPTATMIEALAKMPAPKLCIGDKVIFRVGKILQAGEVLAKGTKAISIKVEGEQGFWRVSPQMVTPL